MIQKGPAQFFGEGSPFSAALACLILLVLSLTCSCGMLKQSNATTGEKLFAVSIGGQQQLDPREGIFTQNHEASFKETKDGIVETTGIRAIADLGTSLLSNKAKQAGDAANLARQTQANQGAVDVINANSNAATATAQLAQ